MDTLIIAQNLNLGYRNNKKPCLLRAGAHAGGGWGLDQRSESAGRSARRTRAADEQQRRTAQGPAQARRRD